VSCGLLKLLARLCASVGSCRCFCLALSGPDGSRGIRVPIVPIKSIFPSLSTYQWHLLVIVNDLNLMSVNCRFLLVLDFPAVNNLFFMISNAYAYRCPAYAVVRILPERVILISGRRSSTEYFIRYRTFARCGVD
jgi:hypothetical protein